MRIPYLASLLLLSGCYLSGPRTYHPVAVDIWCDHKSDNLPVGDASRRHLIVHAVDPFERVEIYREDGTNLVIIDCWATKIHYHGVIPEWIHGERMMVIIYFRRFDDYVKVITRVRSI